MDERFKGLMVSERHLVKCRINPRYLRQLALDEDAYQSDLITRAVLALYGDRLLAIKARKDSERISQEVNRE